MLIPQLRVVDYVADNILQRESHSSPFFPGTVQPKLQESMIDNWSDEAEVFREFLHTRAGRKLHAATALYGVRSFGAVSRVTWVKYIAKGITRFIPIIGWGLLAYDLYNLGDDLEFY